LGLAQLFRPSTATVRVVICFCNHAVSSFLLQLANGTSALFDAGEGTWFQLRSAVGAEEALNVLDSLTLVFISHLHADHHLGLPLILSQRCKRGSPNPLIVVGPALLLPWLTVTLLGQILIFARRWPIWTGLDFTSFQSKKMALMRKLMHSSPRQCHASFEQFQFCIAMTHMAAC
jgi:ribonuclease BN (tRNA processing enzyme)